MSDTRKINTFSFEPSEERPLDIVIGSADKTTIPPKDEYTPAINIVPLRNKITIVKKRLTHN